MADFIKWDIAHVTKESWEKELEGPCQDGAKDCLGPKVSLLSGEKTGDSI